MIEWTWTVAQYQVRMTVLFVKMKIPALSLRMIVVIILRDEILFLRRQTKLHRLVHQFM